MCSEVIVSALEELTGANHTL